MTAMLNGRCQCDVSRRQYQAAWCREVVTDGVRHALAKNACRGCRHGGGHLANRREALGIVERLLGLPSLGVVDAQQDDARYRARGVEHRRRRHRDEALAAVLAGEFQGEARAPGPRGIERAGQDVLQRPVDGGRLARMAAATQSQRSLSEVRRILRDGRSRVYRVSSVCPGYGFAR